MMIFYKFLMRTIILIAQNIVKLILKIIGKKRLVVEMPMTLAKIQQE